MAGFWIMTLTSVLIATVCYVSATCSGSGNTELEFPVALRQKLGICPEGHHRKGRRRSRSHSDITNATSNHSRNHNRHHSTRSPLFENQLLQTLEQKALASKDKKNKTSSHQHHHRKQHHHRVEHHHQHNKNLHNDKSTVVDSQQLLEEVLISKKNPLVDTIKLPKKYQDVAIISIEQDKNINMDKHINHQHVDVSLIPSEEEINQRILDQQKVIDDKQSDKIGASEVIRNNPRVQQLDKAGKNANSVLGRLEDSEQKTAKDSMFVSENCSIVLAQTGSTAEMHCEVSDMGDNTVTWIRRRDYHLLTVGLTTYSSDERFFAAYGKNSQDVALHVRFARDSDAGLYECQISSHPPTSLFVELRLVEAVADIVGGPDKIVKAGSPIRLTCHLRHSTEPPLYVFWYHEQRMINYDLGGGVTVRHSKQSSELVIEHADKLHAGNYSCVPSNARPASVNVHILQNEKPAAMQHGVSKSEAQTSRSAITILTISISYILSLIS